MPAYVLCEVTVADAAAYEGYKALSAAAVEAHGGRFLVRGGPAALLEGDPPPSRIVLLEFPDVAAAQAWYDSPEYAAARAARAGIATARFVVAEGVDPG